MNAFEALDYIQDYVQVNDDAAPTDEGEKARNLLASIIYIIYFQEQSINMRTEISEEVE